MPPILPRRAGELRINGNQKSSYGHIIGVKSVISITQENKPNGNVDSQTESVMEYFRVLELLPDYSDQL